MKTAEQLTKDIFPQSHELLNRYVDILADRGITWGLLGPREADRLWDRHVLNSLALVDLLPHGISIVDVGSGAGLPGIPVALVRPDLQVTLLEPLLRRYEFLFGVVDELGIGDRVTVLRGRAEDSDDVYDAVTCRAVAPLDRLLKWCTPLFYPSGTLYALKGSSAASEVRDAGTMLTASGPLPPRCWPFVRIPARSQPMSSSSRPDSTRLPIS